MTALELIAKEKEERTGKLDLGNCGLTEKSVELEEVWEMEWLEELILANSWIDWKMEWNGGLEFDKFYSKNGRSNANKFNAIPSGIKQLNNLKKLIIGGGDEKTRWAITDLSVLENLVELRELNLNGNKISDIKPLEKLVKLEKLALRGNKITTLKNLKSLNRLIHLDLGFNKIKEISVVKELKQLTILFLRSNTIKNVNELKQVSGVSYLDLADNQITDVKVLDSCKQLLGVSLAFNQIKTVPDFAQVKDLEFIDISSNKISDFPVSFAEKLEKYRKKDLKLKICFMDNPFLGQWDLKNWYDDLDSFYILYGKYKRSRIAYELIEKERKEKTGAINLAKCGLTELPEELFELVWLKELYLNEHKLKNEETMRGGYNNIEKISPALAKLKNLKRLEIYHDNRSSFDKGKLENIDPIGELIELEALYIDQCSVKSVDCLSSLHNLKELRISSTNISDIGFVKNCTKLETIDLSSNHITDISPLEKIVNLKALFLAYNPISDFNPLSNLTLLEKLELARTKVTDLNFAKRLTKLTYLGLSYTKVNDFSPLANMVNLKRLRLIDANIQTFPWTLAEAIKDRDQVDLSFGNNGLFLNNTPGIDANAYWSNCFHLFISDYENKIKPNLQNLALTLINKEKQEKTGRLNLANCGLKELPEELFELTWLEELYLGSGFFSFRNSSAAPITHSNYRENEVTGIPQKIESLKKLRKLVIGSLWGQERKLTLDTSILSKLKELEELHIYFYKIESWFSIKSLKKLMIVGCEINKDYSFEDFTNLENLKLQVNEANIDSIRSKKLISLDLSANIKKFPQKFAQRIENDMDLILNISHNPFIKNTEGLVKEDYRLGNHYETFIYDYNRLFKNPEDKVPVSLPAKLILLGNSNVGKTCLTRFLISNKLSENKRQKSTEILKIREWNKDFPADQKVFIYDFGGQDFYHATYQMFLTKESLNVVLWDKKTNRNAAQGLSERSDPYHDFNVNYWLGNIQYLAEIQDRKIGDEIILLENKIDLSSHSENFLPSPRELSKFGVADSFKVSLIKQKDKNPIFQLYRQILKKMLLGKLNKLLQPSVLTSKQANLVQAVIRYKTKAEKKESLHLTFEEFKDIFDKKNTCNNLDIRGVLNLLADRGLLLYYDGYRQSDQLTGTIIWPSPEKVLEEIHRILVKKFKTKSLSDKGKLTEREIQKIDKEHPYLSGLMLRQQIIFKDEHITAAEKYIVPQLLVDQKDSPLFQISQMGLKHGFSIQFKNFMPYGIFGRLMCLFGKLPDQKYYAKNQMIFTWNKHAKIAVSANLEKLQLHFKVGAVQPLEWRTPYAYLFDTLLEAYYRGNFESENPIDQFKTRKKPKDMQVSLDGEHFVNYEELLDDSVINVLAIDREGNKKQIPTYRFNHFLDAGKQKDKPKKIFISYAPKSAVYLEELLEHLAPLQNRNLIEVWHDNLIEAGEEIDRITKKNLNEANIVILMISAEFLASKYINDVELKETMKGLVQGKNKVIPFIIGNCLWRDWGAFPAWANKNIEQQFLPGGKPDFTVLKALPTKVGRDGPLPLSKWESQNRDDAYMQIVEALNLKVHQNS